MSGMKMGPGFPGPHLISASRAPSAFGSSILLIRFVVTIPVIAPVSPVRRRYAVDLARNRMVTHEDPGTVVAARSIPIPVVVHVPVIAVTIDVVVGILDVVDTSPWNRHDLRLAIELDRRAGVPGAD